MTTLSEAKKLYERFYDGTATQSEVEALARYILSAECPDEWRAERGVFAAIVGESAFTLPQGFTERMASHIQSVTGDDKKAVRLWGRFRKVAAVAVAVAAACIAVAVLWPSTEPSPVIKERTATARYTVSKAAQPVTVQAKTAISDTICLPTSQKKRSRKTSSAALAKTEEKAEENKSQQTTAPATASFYATTAHSEDEAETQLAKAAALLEKARKESRQTIQTLSLDDYQFPSTASPTLTSLTIK